MIAHGAGAVCADHQELSPVAREREAPVGATDVGVGAELVRGDIRASFIREEERENGDGDGEEEVRPGLPATGSRACETSRVQGRTELGSPHRPIGGPPVPVSSPRPGSGRPPVGYGSKGTPGRRPGPIGPVRSRRPRGRPGCSRRPGSSSLCRCSAWVPRRRRSVDPVHPCPVTRTAHDGGPLRMG